MNLLWVFSLLLCVVNAAVVSLNWGNVVYVSKTTTTLQLVVNPYMQRGSPIHDGTFEALSNLQADYVRFVPWLPYPQLGVAELQPPTGNPVCASIASPQILYLGCYQGVFESIDFASYGTPDGRCGGFSVSNCHANMSRAFAEKFCLGQTSCNINATDLLFGDPCPGVPNKRLAVQATCSSSIDKTFWNFTLIDPMMEDVMEATQNHSVIINFSTTPQWMWNTPQPVTYPDDPEQVFWGYEQGNDLRDNSIVDLANYYKRLVQWYTDGGFYDEYSVYHKSGYYYHIPMWEVLNEIESEHGMNPEIYTRIYDAVVTAILEVQPNMEFVGLALDAREPNWLQYFLNSSNHLPNIPLEWISYHFYATTDNSRTNATQFEAFFPLADQFFQEVAAMQAVRAELAPWVKTTIDEIGVILPNDNAPIPDPIADIYWNAAGAMFAYIFGNLIEQGIEVLGESQLVGYPTQFPSVSMMDWITAKPNSRYWVLYLLHESFNVGDQLVETISSDNNLYAQGFLTPKGRVVLIVNKSQLPISVTIENLNNGTITYVDNTTFEDPPATIALNQSTFAVTAFAVAVVSISS